jgi:hypothetical protein
VRFWRFVVAEWSMSRLRRRNIMNDADGQNTITTLALLNAALGRLANPLAPIAAANLNPNNAAAADIDLAITNSLMWVMDGPSRDEFIAEINALLPQAQQQNQAARAAAQAAAPAHWDFENHGEIHFPGGRAKTNSRFTADRADVDPLIRNAILQHMATIRRHTPQGGRNNFYLVDRNLAAQHRPNYSNATVVQITFVASTNTISYHGYPDQVNPPFGLKQSKFGPALQ